MSYINIIMYILCTLLAHTAEINGSRGAGGGEDGATAYGGRVWGVTESMDTSIILLLFYFPLSLIYIYMYM